MRSMTAPVDFESRLPVGSSAKHEGRFVNERPSDGDSLALAAGHMARRMREPMSETHPFQRLGRAFAPLPDTNSLIDETVGDVVDGRHAVEEEELLEHETDSSGAYAGDLLVAQRRRVVPVDGHDALGGPVEGAHDVEQRGFSAPRGSDHGDQFAVVDPNRHIVEGPYRRETRVLLDDVAHLERRGATHDGTTTCVPGWMPVTSTHPSLNMPGST